MDIDFEYKIQLQILFLLQVILSTTLQLKFEMGMCVIDAGHLAQKI